MTAPSDVPSAVPVEAILSERPASPEDEAAALADITKGVLETPSVTAHLTRIFVLRNAIADAQKELATLEEATPEVLRNAITKGV